MVKKKPNISAAMQEYLAVVYRIACYQDDDPFVSTSAIAQEMGVSAPAVTRMMQRLQDRGYLTHEPYQGIALTPAGEREALANIRRHRLVERFLVDVMGFAWPDAHGFASELEPVVSDAVIKRMEEMTGHPRRCPHGEPIPAVDGTIPPVRDDPLSEVEPGAEYIVSRASTYNVEKLKYFDSLGLTPGTPFHLVERAPFEGPLQLRVGKQTHFIGFALAGDLRVCGKEEFDLG